MKINIKRHYLLPAMMVLAICTAFVQQSKPTVFLVGDSTMRNTNGLQVGWGNVADQVFDTARISISNQAMAGRSTRSYTREGRWAKCLGDMKKGDFLIVAFGHNEGARPDTTTAQGADRGVLRGIGQDSLVLRWSSGKTEVVHSYGWYLEKFAREAQAKGVTVVIASMIPRNEFRKNTAGADTVMRANRDYGLWARQTAEKTGSFFVDLNKISSDKYDKFGPVDTKKLFPGDHTHTNADGAIVNAQSVAEGIALQPKIGLGTYLKKFEPHRIPTN